MVCLPRHPLTDPGLCTAFGACEVCCLLPVQAFEDSFQLLTVIAEPVGNPVTEEPLSCFLQHRQCSLLPPAMCDESSSSRLYRRGAAFCRLAMVVIVLMGAMFRFTVLIMGPVTQE